MARSVGWLTALLLPVAASGQMVRVKTADRGVVVTGMEEYIGWVLAGEAGGIRERAALEAIAIAARSYARANLGRHRAEGFDFCETTHCQDARVGEGSAMLRQAVERTANEVLWRGGAVVMGFHHRQCGGRTAAPREVWPGESNQGLVSVDDPYCASAAGGRWRARLELGERELRVESRTGSGRVKTLRDGGKVIDAEAFHLWVGRSFGWTLLRSRLYDLRREGAGYTVEGRGQGHGVGLCQEGAAARARVGQGVEEILRAYYGEAAVGLTAEHRRWWETRTARLDVRHGGAPGDAELGAWAERALSEAERLSGLKAGRRFRVTAYPSVELYRLLTGAAGFVGATTRGAEVRLQPVAVLGGPLADARGSEAVLRHEFLHALIGNNARKPLPEWFSEGLALWLERQDAPAGKLEAGTERALAAAPSEAALRRAYGNARAAVAGLVQRYGRERVLGSLRLGLPE